MIGLFHSQRFLSRILAMILLALVISCKQTISSSLRNPSPIYSPDRPQIYLENSHRAQSLTQQLTTPTCQNITAIYITENYFETPIGTEGNWRPCTTAPSAYSYTLATNTIGDHWLYVWSKNRKGKITPNPKVIPLKYSPEFIWGQPNESANESVRLGLNVPYVFKKIGTKYYLLNKDANAISVYLTEPSTPYQEPDYILGQKPNRPLPINTVTNRHFYLPSDFDSDGTRFVVADKDNNRILIWNNIPTSGEVPANIVLGQINFYQKGANKGKGETKSLLDCGDIYKPYAVRIIGGKILVADSENNRVLIWNTWPTSNGQAADQVLGQNDCSTRTNPSTPTAASINFPFDIISDGTRLAISDYNNHRILVWNSFPTNNNQNADYVLGQTNFTTRSANTGGRTASTFFFPRKMATNGTNLILADYSNSRVLIWNNFPTTTAQPADVVVGQADFTSGSNNRSGPTAASTLYGPNAVSIIDGNLWIVDMSNYRILKYSGIPNANDSSAIFALGKTSLTSQENTYSAGVSDTSMARPMGLELLSNGFIISDWLAHRILGFNSKTYISPTTPADYVLGQSNFSSGSKNAGGASGYVASTTASATSLNGPGTMLKVGTKLFIADSGNNRILGYNSIPNSYSTPPDFVLGQPDFISSSENNGGISATSLYEPRAIASDGTRLAVVDKGNNRVLIWNAIPSTGNVPADVVIGQQTFSSGEKNSTGSLNNSLDTPTGLALVEGKLFVSDYANSRVLIWNTIPSVNGAPANLVLGQDNLTTQSLYNGAISIKPRTIHYSHGKLFIVDLISMSIKIWDSIPTSSNQPADRNFGIYSYPIHQYENPPPLTKRTLADIYDIKSDGERLWITDYGFSKLNVVNIPEASITSELYTKNPNISVTVHSCANRGKVLINEGTRPESNHSNWQDCSTTRDAFTYSTNPTNGLHTLKIWFKDEDGHVLPTPELASFWFSNTFEQGFSTDVGTNTATNSQDVSINIYTFGERFSQSRFYVSESPTPPTGNEAGWISTNILNYSLSNTTNGTKTIYVWAKDYAGNISSNPSTIQIVYDNQAPSVPIVNMTSFYSATFDTLTKFTVNDCSDSYKILANNGTAPTASDPNWISCATSANSISYTINDTTEGSHDVHFWSMDLAGNISTSSRIVNVNFESDIVLGQTSANEVDTAATGYSSPYSIYSNGTKFVVTDYGNARVLIYDGDPISNSPAVVIGQPNFTQIGSNQGGQPSDKNLGGPHESLIVGTKLIVSDSTNNRILIWNSIPTSSYQPADVVIGQPDFTSTTANNGGRSCATLSVPRGIASDGTKLFVADAGNTRVLIFDAIPTTNFATANTVLGQTSCTGATAATSQTNFKTVNDVEYYSNQLIVADTSNNRIAIFNPVPTTTGASITTVLGPSNFTTGTANQGGSTSSSSISNPNSVFVDSSGILYVSDSNNNRVLVWNSIPTVNATVADKVVGQSSFTANSSAQANNRFNAPRAVYADSNYLWVLDNGNHQVKRFSKPLAASGAVATNQVGGYDFAYSSVNLKSINVATDQQLTRPTTAIIVGSKFIVADTYNHRILIWNTIPTTNNESADVVIGHNDFTTTTYNDASVPAGGRLRNPSSVASDGTNLIVCDQTNNRVLIWSAIPTANGTAADIVLGQANFTTLTANRGGSVAANTLSSPYDIHMNGTKLLIADSSNNRVLIWNNYTTVTSGQSADVVVGQADFVTSTANAGGRSATSLYTPRSITTADGKLLILDDNNNRVLIYSSIPTTNGASAVNVIGQTALNGGAAATSAAGLNGPVKVRYFDNKLFIADRSSNRFKVYHSIPTSDGANPDYILGQLITTSSITNSRGLSAWSYSIPQDVAFDGTHYWVVDSGNHRIVRVNFPF